MSKAPWSDQQMEQIIGRLLQVGVLLAAAVVLLGGVLYLVQSGGSPASYRSFYAQRAAFTGFAPILEGVIHLDATAIIELGLLLLIATPVARVIFSVFAFWREKDWTYVAVTCVVLVVLLYSLSGWKF